VFLNTYQDVAMQLKALKIFCDVVVHHSFSQAAEINNITQSTASQSVHRLEKQLGTELINRSVRPWKITESGRRCYEFCRDVLHAYDRLEREISSSRGRIRSKVRIGSIYSVGFCYMTQCTERFSAGNKTDELHVEYLHPEIIIDRVLKDELDLGIVSFPPNRREIEVISCGEEELVIACSPGHELAREDEISPARLEGHSFVGFDRGLLVSRRINNRLKAIGIYPQIVMRFDNIEAIKRAVEDSHYLSILPRPTLERELNIGTLCARPLAGFALTRPLGIIYNKKRKLTPADKEFIQILQNVVEEVHQHLR
jgi:DNA-binding transcriptional LysR family regulator